MGRRDSGSGGSIIRDWQIPLGRRFRSLKLWFVIRSYGLAGLRNHVRNHIELANYFASLVEASADFDVVTDHSFGLVCFRQRGGDDVNQRILDTVNRSGEIYMTHTRVHDCLTLRLAIGSPRTGRERHREGLEFDRSRCRRLREDQDPEADSSPRRRRIIMAVAPQRISPSSSENQTTRPAHISERHAAGSVNRSSVGSNTMATSRAEGFSCGTGAIRPTTGTTRRLNSDGVDRLRGTRGR